MPWSASIKEHSEWEGLKHSHPVFRRHSCVCENMPQKCEALSPRTVHRRRRVIDFKGVLLARVPQEAPLVTQLFSHCTFRWSHLIIRAAKLLFLRFTWNLSLLLFLRGITLCYMFCNNVEHICPTLLKSSIKTFFSKEKKKDLHEIKPYFFNNNK